MAGLSGQIKVTSTMIATLAAGAVNRAEEEVIDLNPSKTVTYTDGATAGKVQRAYYAPITLSASTPLVQSILALACVDGSTGMDYVRCVIYFNDATIDGHDVVVGGGTTPFPMDLAGTNPTQLVRAGTARVLFHKPLGATGQAVGTDINIKLDPGSNAQAGRLLVLGHD